MKLIGIELSILTRFFFSVDLKLPIYSNTVKWFHIIRFSKTLLFSGTMYRVDLLWNTVTILLGLPFYSKKDKQKVNKNLSKPYL